MADALLDGTKIDSQTRSELVAARGTDGLAHILLVDGAGKLQVNVTGFVSGGISAAMGDNIQIVGTDGTSLHNIKTSSTGDLLVDQGAAAALAGAWPVEITDGMNVLGTAGHPLNVTGGGGGVSATDESAFTAGTSSLTPSGGVFNDSVAALTTGQQGTERLTPNRAVHTNLRSQGGTELATASAPLRIDPTGSTVQPVSASSLPLPTGAATAAKQPALGTAGTPSADVISVQGEVGMTALKVDGSAVTQPISGAVNQGTANTPANSWPVEVTDGTNALGTTTHPFIIQEPSDQVLLNGALVSVATALIDTAASGDTTLVTHTTGKSIYVLGVVAIAAAQTNIYLHDSTPTKLTGTMDAAQYGGAVLNPGRTYWAKCTVSTDLVINLSAANQVGGVVVYAVA